MTVPVHDVARLQRMDEGAWASLQDDYFRRIYFYVKRYVGDHQTAEDLTQDVFLGALRGIATFDATYTLDQFLFGIAKNRVIDHYRKHKVTLVPSKADEQSDRSQIWLENMAHAGTAQPKEKVVNSEDGRRQRQVLVQPVVRRDLAALDRVAEEQGGHALGHRPDLGVTVVGQPVARPSHLAPLDQRDPPGRVAQARRTQGVEGVVVGHAGNLETATKRHVRHAGVSTRSARGPGGRGSRPCRSRP